MPALRELELRHLDRPRRRRRRGHVRPGRRPARLHAVGGEPADRGPRATRRGLAVRPPGRSPTGRPHAARQARPQPRPRHHRPGRRRRRGRRPVPRRRERADRRRDVPERDQRAATADRHPPAGGEPDRRHPAVRGRGQGARPGQGRHRRARRLVHRRTTGRRRSRVGGPARRSVRARRPLRRPAGRALPHGPPRRGVAGRLPAEQLPAGHRGRAAGRRRRSDVRVPHVGQRRPAGDGARRAWGGR